MNNIKKYRGLKNITQKDFAEMLGMTRPGLSFVESGNAKNINEKRLNKMSEILNVSAIKLLGMDVFKQIPNNKDDIEYLIEMLNNLKEEL